MSKSSWAAIRLTCSVNVSGHLIIRAQNAPQRRSIRAALVYDESGMSAVTPAYLEIIDFIASGTTPEAVAHFQPSTEAQRRVEELISREKETGLPSDERAELEHFLELEHILRMVKARARQILSRGQ